MKNKYLKVLFLLSLCILSAKANDYENNGNAFPEDFEFGTATSSYQIEGGWNEGGKGWSMWDYLVKTRPQAISDGSNGDIAANSYHLYKRDVEMLKELGVDNYRFSISWPRVMPYGREYVNPEGIAYYNALIDELLANGITPYVTMYHWDLPQNLSELGGWLNEDIVEWFGNYARVLYLYFGDRVKHWLTINEPYIHCNLGYGNGIHAPGIRDPGVGYYECGRNILLANARAYHIYNDEFRSFQGGIVGFVVSVDWGLQATDSEEDAQALEDFRAFQVDYFIHPIWSETGNYPQNAIDRVAEASARQGLNESRLRPFTEEQIEYIKGTMDFLGLNHYSSNYVYRNASLEGTFESPSLNEDIFVGTYKGEDWNDHGFTTEYAPGLYYLLLYLRDTYNNPLIYITENGCSSRTTDLNDDGRTGYFRGYMQAVADAAAEGVNVKGYFAWSLMDNFEWAFGYDVRFGIHAVDMESENRTRTPRKSALVIKEIIRTRVVDYSYDPDPYAVEEQESEEQETEEEIEEEVEETEEEIEQEVEETEENIDEPPENVEESEEQPVPDGVALFYASGIAVFVLAFGNMFIWS